MFYYANKSLKVIKVKRIISLLENYVELQLPKLLLKISGTNLYISYIEGSEIIINGNISCLNIEDFNVWENSMIYT